MTDTVELIAKINSLKTDLAQVRFDIASGKNKKVHLVKKTKKDLARALTELTRGEKNGQKA